MQRENQSKLNKLIQELCPEGVEYKTVGEVCTLETGDQLNKTSLSSDGNYPVYNGGTGPSGYYDDYNTDSDMIIISQGGASAGFVNWVETKFWAGAHCYRVRDILPIVEKKYLYYFLKNIQDKIQNSKQGAGIPGLNKSAVYNFPIPVPPLPVQSEIVRILDAFTALTAELTAELTARRKQYEYYRDRLLKFDDLTGWVRWVELNEVAKGISSGKNKEKLEGGSFPVYGSTGIIAYTETAVYDEPRILVARVGANAGYVHIADGMYDVSDNTLIIDLKMDKALLRYVYHVLTNMNINQYAKGGGQPLITASLLKDLPIPLPPLAEQRRIVSILDRFDALCNDPTVGLPAEIDARRKQYEFYRDRLLDFQRKE